MKRNSRRADFMIDLVLRHGISLDDSETSKENINNTNTLSDIDDGK